jgi:hypothetical protein
MMRHLKKAANMMIGVVTTQVRAADEPEPQHDEEIVGTWLPSAELERLPRAGKARKQGQAAAKQAAQARKPAAASAAKRVKKPAASAAVKGGKERLALLSVHVVAKLL